MTICFVMTVHQETGQALNRLRVLKRVYPEASVVLVGDGPVAPFLKPAAMALGARFKEGEEIKQDLSKRGLWTERWLRAGLESGADLIMKIDPDTGIFARAEFPEAQLFGEKIGDPVGVHGGCLGIRKETAQRIVDSGLLLDEKYSAAEYSYRHRSGVTMSLQDRIFADVLGRLSIVPEAWTGYLRLAGKLTTTKGLFFAHPVP